jgi:hypothetical protein
MTPFRVRKFAVNLASAILVASWLLGLGYLMRRDAAASPPPPPPDQDDDARDPFVDQYLGAINVPVRTTHGAWPVPS